MAGPRGWLYRLLDRGEPDDRDPDTIVEAGYLPFGHAHVVMAVLQDRGIEAWLGEETVGPELPKQMGRVSTRLEDLARVRAVIDEVTKTRDDVAEESGDGG